MGGGRGEVGMTVKGQRAESWADGNALRLGHVSVNNLVVILHLGFERCYHWGKLV